MNPATAHGLSPTSRRMLDLRDAVFVEWERRVRELVAKADQLPHPILIDTLPEFYRNIAEALTPDFPRHDGVEGNSLAAEHGGERARITAYDQEALIREYQLFRWVIYDVLYREGVALSAARKCWSSTLRSTRPSRRRSRNSRWCTAPCASGSPPR